MFNQCYVPNCDSTRKDAFLHKFPSSKERQDRWLKSLEFSIFPDRVDNTAEKCEKFHVCHKHFEKRFVAKNYHLLGSAYPTLFTTEEIASGIPSRQLTFEDDKENFHLSEHDYTQKRPHNDHSYCKKAKLNKTGPDKEMVKKTSGDRVASTSRMDTALQSCTALNIASPEDSESFIPRMQNLQPSTVQNMDYNVSDDPVASTARMHTALQSCEALNIASPGDSESFIPRMQNLQPSTVQNMDYDVSKDPVASSRPKLNVPKQIIVHRFRKLTPECQVLYKKYLQAKRQLNYSKRRRMAVDFTKKIDELTSNMSKYAKKFLMMQIKMCTKEKKARRFTMDEKLLALAILKQSPKCYRFLRKIFILPSKTTLNKMIGQLKLHSGINSQIFNTIKEEVQEWDEKKKYCTIIFDEMALEPSLTYNENMDTIHGLVELSAKKNEFADHALTFILRGAVYKWQQPIAFYFSKGAASSIEMKKIIKEIVEAVTQTGLIPLALVSDQGSSFQTALKLLQEETRGNQIKSGIVPDDTISLSGSSLSIIYDPCHLIKGMRNNFLTKNMVFDGKKCSWQDIVDVYKIDCNHSESRLLHKLTDEHVIPKKIKKMKVKHCVKVLSKTMAAALSYTSNFSAYADGSPVSKTLKNTSAAVAFLDDLFDSVNGTSTVLKKQKGKKLKTAVTEKSPHLQFWQGAIKIIEKIRFINSDGREISVPTLKNWRITLKSFLRIQNILKSKGVKIIRPRYFNSDPVENFFGQIRAYNCRYTNPDCYTFVNTFKSLLITGILKQHSDTFNCEDAASDPMIKAEKLFAPVSEDSNVPQLVERACEVENKVVLENIQTQVIKEKIKVNSRAYTAGWVVRKINQKFNCLHCKNSLTTQNISAVHRWIHEREYKSGNEQKLCYPSEPVVRLFGNIMRETNEYLEKSPHTSNLKVTLKNLIKSKYSLEFFACVLHKSELTECFLDATLKLSIYNWCSTINKIIKGIDIVRLKQHLPPMQKKALLKYNKKLKNKSLGK